MKYKTEIIIGIIIIGSCNFLLILKKDNPKIIINKKSYRNKLEKTGILVNVFPKKSNIKNSIATKLCNFNSLLIFIPVFTKTDLLLNYFKFLKT
tara:strand:- start:15229 stop:15510 length:282 start_codon:yes stop_codon:yes gene_type:complete